MCSVLHALRRVLQAHVAACASVRVLVCASVCTTVCVAVRVAVYITVCVTVCVAVCIVVCVAVCVTPNLPHSAFLAGGLSDSSF